jgi:regulator of protease activity HflC (stomatin/prohibitin superfamily)
MLETYTEDGELRIAKVITHSVGALALFAILMGSFFITSGTEYAILKSPNGKLSAITNGGVHFKVPFFSDVHRYDMVQKTTYVDDDDKNDENYGTMKRITFNDTYGGMIGGTLLYRLDPTKLIEVHKTYGNQENLVENGLKPISKQLLAYTANQFSGENFMQGAQNEYQNRVEDQANNGLIVTKREKVKVEKNMSTVGVNNQNPRKRPEREEFIFVTTIQYEKDGVTPKRIPLAITELGIKLAQVTIDDFKPDPKLREFINRKQTQIATRQTIIEKQENARQGSILAEANGEMERIKAKQEQLKDKDIAVILADKKVELERKDAEKQVVQKQKDLDIALMEKKIQKAKSESAIFKAKAIEAQGLAEAKVKKAMYLAVRKDSLTLETNKAIAKYKYSALPNVKITMPTTVMTGGGEGGSLQELTNLHIIDKIK